ncbi:rod shape-determining protein MreD [Desulforhopalus singaporensis]|uniref:Rod shape-determining protein MreD n=1 Tax=Desulforhopalus singaporensis TaxID=91360 RepID=A0A1H0R839_9BACT|nr:rod shape-determining protein MreD [Desulforhopalus singaporensis]SDP25319.1 rod shape-determining protein MreD [Desulforhopalus singaporensis]
MKLAVIFWFTGVLLVVAQTTILQFLPSWLGRPDFLYIFVAFIAYRFAWIPGIVTVFSLGWIVDVIAGIQLGFYPLQCLITFATLKTLTHKSPVKETTYQIPLVGLSYFAVQMLLYFVYSLASPELLSEWSWGVMLQRTALITVSAIPVFVLCTKFYEYLLKKQLKAKSLKRRPRKY